MKQVGKTRYEKNGNRKKIDKVLLNNDCFSLVQELYGLW